MNPIFGLMLTMLLTISQLTAENNPVRDRLLSYLDETEAYLIEHVKDLSGEEWNYREAEGRWSVAECATHIFLVEKRIFETGVLETAKVGEYAEKEIIATAASLDPDRIIATVNDRIALKGESPEFAKPVDVLWDTPDAFITEFRAHRKKWKDYAANTEARLTDMVKEIPFGLGNGNLYHYQIFGIAHTSRHTQQIEGVKRAMGKNWSEVSLTGGVKVNYPVALRQEVQTFFAEMFGSEITPQANIDRVKIGEGFVAFVYQDSKENVLSEEEHLKGVWMQLNVPWYAYESVKSQLKARGFQVLKGFEEKIATHYYFQIPGGLVFRLAKGPKESSGYSYNANLSKKLGADEYGMSAYVMAFLKAGPNSDLSKEEAARLQLAHLKNIDRLAAAGKLALAGPFMDKGPIRGIYIFNVQSLEEARELTSSDPAIKAGSLVMELHPWYGSAALKQVNELHKAIKQRSPAEAE